MGKFGSASRSVIIGAFEGCCGDMRGEVEPGFVEWRSSRATAIEADLRPKGDTLEVRYRILDDSLDDEDVMRIFLFAYLDVFTRHAWLNANTGRFSSVKLSFLNETSGAASVIPYPDPE